MATNHTITSYQIDEHPSPDSVYDWVRNNWHDLGDFSVQEAIDSFTAFCRYFDADSDYAVSIVPDRGEYLTASIKNDDIAGLSGARLFKYIQAHYRDFSKCCPFTGVCYDDFLLDPIRKFMKKPDSRTLQDLLDDCLHNLLITLHKEGEYIYSDDGIYDMCQSNEYEFIEHKLRHVITDEEEHILELRTLLGE